MKHSRILTSLLALLLPLGAGATHFVELKVVDKDYLMVHFRDGEVRYRDDATGPSAYLGHSFAEGDDTLVVFSPRLKVAAARVASSWTVCSEDDKGYGDRPAAAVSRKCKPMNIDHTLSNELDHWIFLRLSRPMKQGCTYTVVFPANLGGDVESAQVRFDIFSSVSQAVHVNILGYTPDSPKKAADLYLWLGDGGARDYTDFEGAAVWLYNVGTGKSVKAGKVSLWKDASASVEEAGKKDLTGSGVWNADFTCSRPGRYRLAVEGVGCSMDFDIAPDVYFEPFRYSVRGYYYMRLGEPVDLEHVSPAPRQPRFIPEEDPDGFTVYKTDLQPWHPDWRLIGGDVWDEPHFKPALASEFWKHRLPGNPVNVDVRGGHSDAFDWDRHLAHVSNIYDLLLPYILTGGRIGEDNLGIRESGNGIPDIIDEARNEVDFFLSIRDGEGYSQGVTNPSVGWKVMYQAGCTTMAAWANAANCAMLAEAFRISGHSSLRDYYAAEAVKAYEYASRQEWDQLDDRQGIGDGSMTGRDFRQMAAAFLYNVTGERKWEDAMAADSEILDCSSLVHSRGRYGHCQIWGTAAYLECPRERHYPSLYSDMCKAVDAQAQYDNVRHAILRPSRRSCADERWQTSENLQIVMLAHYVAGSKSRRAELEKCMYLEADWGLGRNPTNTVEMTGLGERHITDCYSTGRNDGAPGTHPGQTPFNGTETWSKGNGGDADLILEHCWPDWYDGGWPRQESFFNQRYFWVNGEFTPRETMRGKMALLGYLYGIRK